jgi:hypothetical protein
MVRHLEDARRAPRLRSEDVGILEGRAIDAALSLLSLILC